MPDQSMPPLPYSLAMLVNKLRQTPANYQGYAQTRLGRQPVMYAQNEQSFEELDNPFRNPLRHDYGATFMQPSDLGAANVSPLHDPVSALLKSTGQPVSAIRPYEKPVSGPGGTPGTEPGVPLHESTHQFVGNNVVPPALLFTRTSPEVKSKVESALGKMGYKPEQFADEIPARLFAGQYASLGLTADEGHQFQQTYLDMYQKMAPDKAARMGMYTKGRAPVSWVDPKTGQSVSNPNRDPETGVEIK